MKKNETILDNEIFIKFEQLVIQLNQMKTQVTGIQQNIKQLEKSVKKKMKGLKKEVNKTKNKGNRQPSGFAKPSKVTKELCEFMNKDEGSEIARTEVTRTLVAYIKENKEISHLPLIKQSRLSVMPIDSKSWKIICKMGRI